MRPDVAVARRRLRAGTALAIFDADGPAVVHKQAIAASWDLDFATEARETTGTPSGIERVRFRPRVDSVE
jgi:hypothetical protein